MTEVHVKLTRPVRGSTDREPVPGQLDVSLFRRQEEGDHFVLVTAFAQVLVDGEATLELTPTDGTNAWVVNERVRDGKVRMIAVPSSGPVEYVDLADLDPATLEPTDNTVAAWEAAAALAVAAQHAAETAAASAQQYAGGSAQRAANLSDLASISTARTNLGLDTAATQPASAFDPAGAAAAAQTAAQTAAQAAAATDATTKANAARAAAVQRANHTGTQLASTISDFGTAVAAASTFTAGEADWVISTSAGTITAQPRDAALSPISGTNAAVVINAVITALTPAGAQGTGGGKIKIRRGTYVINDELVINGWEAGYGTLNYSMLEIEGEGLSTLIQQQTGGKNAFVIRDAAAFALRDLRIQCTGTTTLSGILADKNGAHTEISFTKAVINNVEVQTGGATAPAVYLKNFFHLTAPYLSVIAARNHAVVLENNSTTTNYGNSHFGLLATKAGPKATGDFAGLYANSASNIMNMISIDHLEVGPGCTYGFWSNGLAYSAIEFADIEFVDKPVYLTGTSSLPTKYVDIRSGYLLSNAAGTAITSLSNTCGNSVKASIAGPSDATPLTDTNTTFPPSNYDLTVFGQTQTNLISVSSAYTALNVRTSSTSVITRLPQGATVPTATPGTNNTQVASTGFVAAAVTAAGGAPSDASTTVKGIVQLAGDLAGTAAAPTVPGLATKAPLASPALTGTPTVPTATPGTATTQAASTAFVAAVQALLAPIASPTFTGTVSGISKAMVGLGNVDNTADASKPISTATQTALNGKSDIVSGASIVVKGLATGTAAAAANAALVQAAMDTLTALGGGTAIVPTGSWYSAPLTMRTRVTLAGLGWGSVLNLANGANTNFITLYDGLTEQTMIRDIRLDGNKANQTGGNVVHYDNTAFTDTIGGLSLRDPDHAMRRVAISNGKNDGLFLAGSLSQSIFEELFSYQNDNRGIEITSPDNHFVNCIVAMSGTDNVYIAGNSNRFVNCKSWLAGQIDATNGSGFRIATVDRIDLLSCEAQDNRQHGFSLNSTKSLNMRGCRADRNGLGADSNGYAGDGVFAFTVTNSTIDYVSGDRNAGGLKQRWAYNCGAGNDSNIVTISAGPHASGVIGNGSWGANSSVITTYNGALTSTFANLASPTFTGTPAAPTAAMGTSTTQLATTAFVGVAQSTVVGVALKTGAYTTVLTDAGKLLLANSTSAITFTIPLNATTPYPLGTVIPIGNFSTGALTIAATAGVTILSPAGLRITTQYAQASLIKTGNDSWLLSGQTVV